MTAHPNSIKSNRKTDKNARLQAIMSVLAGGRMLTDRQIAYELNFSDCNGVRPRLTEAIQDGLIEECGTIKCTTTGRTVRLVKLVEQQEELFI